MCFVCVLCSVMSGGVAAVGLHWLMVVWCGSLVVCIIGLVSSCVLGVL